MDKLIKYGLAVLLNIAISGVSWAVMLTDSTDVGEIDSILAVATKAKGPVTTTTLPNSGEASETAWVDLVLSDLGIDTTNLHTKYKIAPAPVVKTDTPDVYAMALNPQVSAGAHYFILKNANYWALFENNMDMDWAVVDINDVPAGMKIPNDWEVSHIHVFSVPEPPVLALLGLGLLSFGLASRRRRRQ